MNLFSCFSVLKGKGTGRTKKGTRRGRRGGTKRKEGGGAGGGRRGVDGDEMKMEMGGEEEEKEDLGNGTKWGREKNSYCWGGIKGKKNYYGRGMIRG